MALNVVGAGVGRTGTHSLKIALEQLCGGTCHHMLEVFPRPEQAEYFTRAIDGEVVDWTEVYAEFSAMVDFPGALFWREAAAAFPDAPVLLSTRPAEDWYRSASNTIFLAFALAYAETLGASDLAIGVNAIDYSGYPDCRDNTLKALQVALSLGMDAPMVVETPLMWLSKAQTWQMAADLGGDALQELEEIGVGDDAVAHETAPPVVGAEGLW